jgi:hypothetical protein
MRVLQGDSWGRAGSQAVVKVRVAHPWERVGDKPKDQIGRRRGWQNEQQVSGGMADGAGEMGLRMRIDGLMRVHYRVADLHEQQCQAEA